MKVLEFINPTVIHDLYDHGKSGVVSNQISNEFDVNASIEYASNVH